MKVFSIDISHGPLWLVPSESYFGCAKMHWMLEQNLTYETVISKCNILNEVLEKLIKKVAIR